MHFKIHYTTRENYITAVLWLMSLSFLQAGTIIFTGTSPTLQDHGTGADKKHYIFISEDAAKNTGISFKCTATPTKGTVNAYSWNFPGGTPSSSPSQNPGTVKFASAVAGVNHACTLGLNHTGSGTPAENCTTVDKTISTITVVIPEFEITINTFIPANNIDHPIDSDLVFGGDDRTFSKNGSSRTKHVFTAVSAQSVDADGLKNSSETKSCGQTSSYQKSSSLDTAGKLTAAAKADTTSGAPLKVDWATASTSGTTVTFSRINDKKVKATCTVDAGNPLVTAGPHINYDLEIIIDSSDPGKPTYTITGTHDGYPGYEVYIRDQRIHHYDPGTTATPWSLWGDSDKSVNNSGNVQ